MTRYLSQALGAEEPHFSQGIAALERASGSPSEDIRLSTEIVNRVKAKLSELDLDPNDTTDEELYETLQHRLEGDDQLVRRALHITNDSTPSAAVTAVYRFLSDHIQQSDCFVLKTSVARRLLKQCPPRTVMKKLGYRSLDSLLKREHPADLYVAASMVEGESWHKRYRSLYATIRPSDFESRPISFYNPMGKYWQQLAGEYVAKAQHNMFCLKELGSIVMLPIEESIDGLAILQLLLALGFMNDIRAQSSFAKLQQVKPNFGSIIGRTSLHEAYTTAVLAGQTISWRMIQRYYGRLSGEHHLAAFGPYIQAEDLQWDDAEDLLTALDPALRFWQGTQCLCVMSDNGPVSMNILDVALNYCNHVPFTKRVVGFLRDNIWQELMARYLHQQNLEAALQQQLSADLVAAPELADLPEIS